MGGNDQKQTEMNLRKVGEKTQLANMCREDDFI